jgi:large conductance mechanosensitive channel
MLAEFKEFIGRGNMIELAVAFVMGVAFQAVISTLTERVLMPAIALVFGEPDFDRVLMFGAIDPETGLPVGSAGALLTALIDFLIVAFALFMVIKAYNRFQRRSDAEEVDPEAAPEDVVLLREIRDALRAPDRGPR